MRHLLIQSLAALVLLATPPLPARSEPLRFPPRPRVLLSADQLLALRADGARANERSNLLAQAHRLLQSGLKVPTREGNWIFYYACPDHNTDLRPESDDRHVCPTCKRVFEDERTKAAYRTRLYNELERHLQTLATAYAVTGDARFAAPVREALLSLARAWPTLPRHDRWGRTGLLAVVGGRRYCQLLDEATSLISLAGTWDLVLDAPGFTAEDRALIEKQLFRMPADELALFQGFTGSRNNHQTWFNAAYAVTGLALGDEALLRRGVEGDVGLLWQLEKSITSDGLWYEGALAYHFYALQAIMKTLEAARTAGLDYSGDRRLKSLWTGPLQLAYPNGQCPVFHDSDPASLANYKPFFEWGARYFKDPALAAGDPSALGSTNLAGIGIAVLRRGGGDAAACAMLDYGLHGDHHGHPDKLNLVLFARGRERLLDPGRISYSVPEYKTWCRTTAAHNTVVLDGRDQQPDTGRLLLFADTPAAAACLAASDGAYPGNSLRRGLVLGDGFLVDFFSVRRNRAGLLDWFLHAPGDPIPAPDLAPRPGKLEEPDGYPHLSDLREGVPAAPCPVFIISNTTPMAVWTPAPEAGERFLTGLGIGYSLPSRVPFLLRRRRAETALFAAVYDLSGGTLVTNVALLPVYENGRPLPSHEAAALRLDTPSGSRLAAFDFSESGLRQLTAGGLSFTRWRLSETKDCE